MHNKIKNDVLYSVFENVHETLSLSVYTATINTFNNENLSFLNGFLSLMNCEWGKRGR